MYFFYQDEQEPQEYPLNGNLKDLGCLIMDFINKNTHIILILAMLG